MTSFCSTCILLSLMLLNAVFGETATDDNVTTSETYGDRSDYKKSLFQDCDSSFSLTCIKLELVTWVDKISQQEEYNLLPGVALVREPNAPRSDTAELVAEVAKSFPTDPESRLNVALLKKLTGFLTSHSVKVKFLNEDTEQVESGRGKGGGGGGGGGGKKGQHGILLAGILLLKGTLLAIALGTLAALAGKALLTGTVALVLSSIIGLKALTHKEKAHYEVVSKPIYSHEKVHSVSHEDYHDSHGHNYGRSLKDVPLPLGLHQDYKPY